jgi:hypothetical protein
MLARNGLSRMPRSVPGCDSAPHWSISSRDWKFWIATDPSRHSAQSAQDIVATVSR